MRGRTSRRSTSSIRPWPSSRPRAPATACSRGSTTSIGDGWPDILVLGRVHLHPAYWYENPRGGEGLWKKHYVFERIQGETPPFADLNQDGKPELVCHWENRWGYVAPDWSRPAEPWSFHPITGRGRVQPVLPRHRRGRHQRRRTQRLDPQRRLVGAPGHRARTRRSGPPIRSASPRRAGPRCTPTTWTATATTT